MGIPEVEDREPVLAWARALQAPHPPLRGGGGSAAGGSRNPAEPPPPPPPLGGRSSRSMRWCSGPALASLLRHDRRRRRRRRRRQPGGGGCQKPTGSRPPRSLGPEPPGSSPLHTAPPQHWPAPSPDVRRRSHAQSCGARWVLKSTGRGLPPGTLPTEGVGRRISSPEEEKFKAYQDQNPDKSFWLKFNKITSGPVFFYGLSMVNLSYDFSYPPSQTMSLC